MNEPKKRGRPPKPADEVLVRGTVFLTAPQWAKIAANGGQEWLRKLIDKARPPKG